MATTGFESQWLPQLIVTIGRQIIVLWLYNDARDTGKDCDDWNKQRQKRKSQTKRTDAEWFKTNPWRNVTDIIDPQHQRSRFVDLHATWQALDDASIILRVTEINRTTAISHARDCSLMQTFLAVMLAYVSFIIITIKLSH